MVGGQTWEEVVVLPQWTAEMLVRVAAGRIQMLLRARPILLFREDSTMATTATAEVIREGATVAMATAEVSRAGATAAMATAEVIRAGATVVAPGRLFPPTQDNTFGGVHRLLVFGRAKSQSWLTRATVFRG